MFNRALVSVVIFAGTIIAAMNSSAPVSGDMARNTSTATAPASENLPAIEVAGCAFVNLPQEF